MGYDQRRAGSSAQDALRCATAQETQSPRRRTAHHDQVRLLRFGFGDDFVGGKAKAHDSFDVLLRPEEKPGQFAQSRLAFGAKLLIDLRLRRKNVQVDDMK